MLARLVCQSLIARGEDEVGGQWSRRVRPALRQGEFVAQGIQLLPRQGGIDLLGVGLHDEDGAVGIGQLMDTVPGLVGPDGVAGELVHRVGLLADRLVDRRRQLDT